jgi:mycothiol synthase
MDETRYRLREYRERDYATQVRVSDLLNPERRHTELELRRWEKILRTPPSISLTYVVEERSSGAAAAFGQLMTQPGALDPSFLWAGVSVDPDHQGRGIGRYLADVLEQEARRLGTAGLWAVARADRPRDVAFPERRGFRELGRRWRSRLELPAPGYSSIPRRGDALAAEGIEFTTLAEEGAERPEVRQGVFELFVAVEADEPRLGKYTPNTFEQFVAMNLAGPGFLPAAFFLARKDRRYIGVSNLELLPAEPGVLHQILTGTLGEFRGRGIATELKRRTVDFGQRHGFRSIRTENASTNHPMWAINRKLGYPQEAVLVEWEKTLG